MKQWPQDTPKNIIVRMPNWLGDLVMATPILADLRNKWPEAKITAMCQEQAGTLLKNNPHVNEILSFKKPSGSLQRKERLAITDPLKKGKFDLGILLTHSFSSAWWLWRGGVKNRIGFRKNLRGWMLNKSVAIPENNEVQHLVITYKRLLEPMGISISDTEPTLYVNATEKNEAQELLKKHGMTLNQEILIGINPGAAYGSAKCWLPERFKEVTQKLLKNPKVRITYFGDNTGAPLVNDICNDFPERVVNLAGKTSLRELIALIDLCNIFLTNDSGPMHIAAALKKPLLAIFGSTNEVKTGPYPKGKVIHKHVECSPCYKRICPIDFRCMTRISVDEVYEELQELLKENT